MFSIKIKLLLFLILYFIKSTIQINLENQLEKLEGNREDKKCKCEGEYKFNCTEACSPNGISFLVEGLEKSDFGLSLGSSDYQRSREANGFIHCNKNISDNLTLLNVFYDSQKTPDNYAPEAIRILCLGSGGMGNFCVCDKKGDCYTSVKNNTPTYVELAPYCDPYEGPNVYMELYKGELNLESDKTKLYTQKFNNGPFGCGSEYMKVSAVSCNGCSKIGQAVREKTCKGDYVPNKLDAQNIRDILFGIKGTTINP
uniref:Uncharacterized protein n=1 Tax=Meloidogyne enterolobii TaxID=390850 RepID=A0A6V7U6Q8_MELEN|nr:unnamed protein product [Meloidogyne enterolobii]